MATGNDIDFTVRLKEDGLKEATKNVSDLDRQFEALANQQALIQQFIKLKQETASAGQAFDNAQAHAQKLGRELANTESPTRQQTAAFTQARAAVNSTKEAYQAAQLRMQAMRGTLAENNIETTGLAQKQAALRQGMRALEVQAAANTARMQELGAKGPQAMVDTAQATERATASTKGYGGALTQVAGAVAGLFAAGKVVDYARSVNDVADQYKNLEARVRLAVGAQADLGAAVQGIGKVALDTNSNLDATAELFGRLAASAKELNITQTEALAITKTINQSIQVSGASAQASEASVRQLVQALQSGVLRGDEFNSIMEQSPRLSKALADGLNVPIGALRGMAEQGELTSARVIRALKGQADTINQEFATLPLTTGRALENLSTQWTLFIGKLTGGAQQSSVVAQGINALAQNLDTLAGVAARAGATLTAALAIQAVMALKTFAAEMLATGKAASLLSLELSKIPKTINIALAVTGLEVGFQIGTMLHENSELARKFGVGLVGFMQALVNDLVFLKEAAAAIFTSDTIDAAFDRYIQRGKEMDAVLADMWKDAENAPSKVAAAADASAAGLGKMSGAGIAAGQAIAAGASAGAAGLGQVKSASEDARVSLAGLANAINSKPTKSSIADIALDLAAAKMRGEDLEIQLREKLPQAIEKLSGAELQKFRADFVLAMDEAKQALQEAIKTGKSQAEIVALQAKVDSFARATRAGLQLIAEQAAQNLGVDVPMAFGKVSDGFRQAQENMSVLIRQLPQLKAAGVDTGLVVGQALNNMISGAKNQAELDAVIQRIKLMRKELGEKVADGLLEQATEKAKALKASLQDALPGIQSVEEAMRRLGVTSDQALKDAAKSSREAYEAVASSGTASAREISLGFKKAAEDAIAAAKNGVAPAWVTAQAGLRGYKIEVDAAGKATLVSMKEAEKAINGVGDAARNAAGGFDQMAQSAEAAAAAAKKAEEDAADAQAKKDGYTGKDNMGHYSRSSSTDTGTRQGIIEWLKGAGLDEAVAEYISRDFVSPDGTVEYMGNGGQKKWRGNTMSNALSNAVDYYKYGEGKTKAEMLEAEAKKEKEAKEARAEKSKPQNTASPAPAPTSGSSSGNTYVSNVYLTLDTKRYSPVRTDQQGALTLESFLRDLKDGKSLSQGV